MGWFDGWVANPFYRRIMFPVCDPYGEFLAFQGRAIDTDVEPKYFHSSFDKGLVLYGVYEQAEQTLRAPFITVVEGPLDVMSVFDAGLPAFGTLGSSFSYQQACLIARYTTDALLWFDTDKAGQRAEDSARKLLKEVGVRCTAVPSVRPYKDPNEAMMKAGRQGVLELINARS